MWSIDTITNLPPDPEGNSYIVVAVDAFTKWVELGIFPNKTAAGIAKWIETMILARYGTPHIIRTDNGKEFEGEVDQLLEEYGVKRHKTSPGHPQANG